MSKYFTGVKTVEELRKCYRELLKKYHPDNENGSTEITQQINQEYDAQFAILSKQNKSDGQSYTYEENERFKAVLNEIRSLYGRTPVNESVVTSIVKGISSELIFDIVADKFLGQVPLIGIYFNAICAKTMTWRLGILFTMLSARGEAIDDNAVQDTTRLIRSVFPQTDAFKFQQPTYPTFEKLIVSVSNNSMKQFNQKITKALDVFND